MPFDAAFDDVYKLAIQAAAIEASVVAERVDEQRFSERILDQVYRQIRTADFIIADMTGMNANVFYEVGYAHAHEKLCTLITQRAEDIPFDLKHHRHLIYNTSLTELKSKLSSEFSWLKNELSVGRNPILVELSDAWAELISLKTYGQVVTHLRFTMSNKTQKRSPDIEAIYLITSPRWKFEQGGDSCASLLDESDKQKVRHFIKSPVPRLSPGSWAQIQVEGTNWVFPEVQGGPLKEDYQFKGTAWLEIVTSEGTYSSEFEIELDTAEIPF